MSKLSFCNSNLKNELVEKLEKLAWQKSKPFCYGCYIEVLSSHCPSCFSDDLARLVEGIGVDWNINWVMSHLIEENLSPVDLEQMFEASVSGCYPDYADISIIRIIPRILLCRDSLLFKEKR